MVLYEVVCDSHSEYIWATKEELIEFGTTCPICGCVNWTCTGRSKDDEDKSPFQTLEWTWLK